jgi:hypothetical protein
MAIRTPLGGTGGISDATINTMLQSGDRDLINKANEYIAQREKEIKEREADKGILGIIADLFGFSKLAAAEPDQKEFNNLFSVTQEPQFQLRNVPEVPGTNVMTGSVMKNIIDTPTREFGEMLVGKDDQAIFGNSTGQRFNVENNPELFFNTAEGKAKAEEDEDFLDYLQDISGGVVDLGKDLAGRSILSKALAGAGTMTGGPLVGLGGGIIGLLKGGDLFNTNTLSQRRFDAMTPGQKAYTSSLYAPGGLLEGYNQVSAFGQGALGTLSNRLDTIQNTLAKQGANPSKILQQREQQIKDAIDKSINIGESEALGDKNRSVTYGSQGPVRTDIDLADGGAETGGGGKIVCTMMNKSYGFGSFRNKIWLRQSKDLAPEYQKGYHILFLPLVKIAKTNKTIKKVLEHIAVHRTIDIRQESRGKTHMLGRIYRKILEPICYWVGKYAKR